MKDSGLGWVGSIPEGWGVGRIGGLYKHRNSKVNDVDYPPLSVTMQGIVPQLETAAKSNDHDNRKMVKVGDFAINSRSDRRGSCGISAYDGSVSLINTVLEPRDAMNPAYYGLLFHTSEFADEFYKWGHGIVDDLWTTRWTEMKSMKVPVPSLEEQQRIADYLGARCREIDTVKQTLSDEVEALQRLRKATIHKAVTKGLEENVPMKDSGVEWIGLMPNTWESRKVKFMFEIVKRIAGKEGFDVLAITQQGIVVKDITISEGQQLAKDYSGYQFVYPGDFAMNHMDLITGWVDCSKLFGVTSPDYRVFRPMKNRPILKEYYKYVFQNCYSNRIFYHLGNGVSGQGRWRLQAPAFKNFVVPVPPLGVQQRIADYLDERCAAIDSVIETRTKQLERLEDYRRALVFAYVTGKKEVPVA